MRLNKILNWRNYRYPYLMEISGIKLGLKMISKNWVFSSTPSQKAVYVLRKCLPDNIQSLTGSCEDDVNVMVNRLEKQYADQGKIVDANCSEIKGFRRFKANDSVRIIQFVNILDIYRLFGFV